MVEAIMKFNFYSNYKTELLMEKSRDLKTKWCGSNYLIDKFNFGFSIWSHPLLKKISVHHHCDCWPCMKSR